MPQALPTPVLTLRPGERMVAGKPYVFNADALNLHLAREAVAAAPADLSSLSDADLRSLGYRVGRVMAADQTSHPVSALVSAEYAARGWDSGGATNRSAEAGLISAATVRAQAKAAA